MSSGCVAHEASRQKRCPRSTSALSRICCARAMGPEPNNAYERARIERIARNQVELARLGLTPDGSALLPALSAARRSPRRPPEGTKPGPASELAESVPARRSSPIKVTCVPWANVVYLVLLF